MSGIRTIALAALLLAGCQKKEHNGGLPPASSWKPGEGAGEPSSDPLAREMLQAEAEEAAELPPGHGGGGQGDMPMDDIHGGLAGSDNDEMPNDDIHAGLGGGGQGEMPSDSIHGGGGGGVDVEQLGLPAPDPDQPIDPAKVIQGTLRPVDATRDKVPKGGVIFLSVRALDASGQPTGMPLAVHKVALDKWPLFFQLDGGKAMVGGTSFEGEVAVMARYDQDQDALSKQPGDVTGMVKTKIPAKDLDLRLDTVLP